MAEIDRELLRARDREGRPLPPGARVVLVYLWTWVETAAAAAYRRREGRRPRIRRLPPARIAAEVDLGVRQVQRHLDLLEAAGLIGRDGSWLDLFDGLEQRQALLDPESSTSVKAPGVIHDASDATPRRVKHDATTRHLRRDDASPVTRAASSMTHDPLGVPIGSQLGPERGSPRTRASAAHRSVTEIAREIVSLAPTPRLCSPLPTSDDGIAHLVTLLLAGWPREQIAATLRAAPAIVERGLADPRDPAGQQTRWYGPEMFRGERWSHWRAAAARLESTEPAAVVDPAELAAQREAEEAALRRILATVETPPEATEWERIAWRAGPRWRASVLFRPGDARRVVAEELALCEQEGRRPSAADLARALSSLELPDDVRADESRDVHRVNAPCAHAVNVPPDRVLAELRRRRERAEAEGRALSLAELQGVTEDHDA